MTKRVFTGKTVDDAIRKGLTELGVSKEDVSVTVLEHHSKGFLGLFGVKEAKVELEWTEKQHVTTEAASEIVNTVSTPVVDDPVFEAKLFLASILEALGLQTDIVVKEDRDGVIVFEVNGSDLGILIGRRGQTLDAIQTLVNVNANRWSEKHVRIILDAEGFRERRKKTLEDLSMRLANQVVRTKKEVLLEPMPANERRVIHYKLQNHPKVKTYSKGEEPNRRIVIALK